MLLTSGAFFCLNQRLLGGVKIGITSILLHFKRLLRVVERGTKRGSPRLWGDSTITWRLLSPYLDYTHKKYFQIKSGAFEIQKNLKAWLSISPSYFHQIQVLGSSWAFFLIPHESQKYDSNSAYWLKLHKELMKPFDKFKVKWDDAYKLCFKEHSSAKLPSFEVIC